MSKIKEARRPTLAVIDEHALPEIYVTPDIEVENPRKLLDENDNVYSHLNLLKEKTAQLNLSTRRPSFVTWRNECLDDSGRRIKAKLPNVRGDNSINQNELTLDKRIDNIDGALVWIKQELVSIYIYEVCVYDKSSMSTLYIEVGKSVKCSRNLS